MVSVTHLILRFAIVQNKFQQTNKNKINHINDNHIKFEVSLHFGGIWHTVCQREKSGITDKNIFITFQVVIIWASIYINSLMQLHFLQHDFINCITVYMFRDRKMHVTRIPPLLSFSVISPIALLQCTFYHCTVC